MAVKDLTFGAFFLTSLLVLMGVAGPVSAFSDNEIPELPRDVAYSEDVHDTRNSESLPELLRLLRVVMKERKGKRELGYSTDEKSYHSVATMTPHERNELSSLLDKLTSSSSSLRDDQNFDSSVGEKNYDDLLPKLTSKRTQDEAYGAMPPLNELCRMMRVRCY